MTFYILKNRKNSIVYALVHNDMGASSPDIKSILTADFSKGLISWDKWIRSYNIVASYEVSSKSDIPQVIPELFI